MKEKYGSNFDQSLNKSVDGSDVKKSKTNDSSLDPKVFIGLLSSF